MVLLSLSEDDYFGLDIPTTGPIIAEIETVTDDEIRVLFCCSSSSKNEWFKINQGAVYFFRA